MKKAVVLLIFACAPSWAEDLRQIYEIALKSDPVIKSAQASAKSADALKRESRGAFFPTLSVSGDRTALEREVGSAATTKTYSTNYGAQLSQPLFHLPLWTGYQISSQAAAVENIKLRNAHQSLILRVTDRYFTALGTLDNLEFARAEKSAVSRQLEQVKKRFEVGLIAITDVHESEARRDLTVAQEIEAVNDHRLSQESLREVTGQLYEQLQPLSDNLPLKPPPLPEQKSAAENKSTEPKTTDDEVKTAADDWVALALQNNTDVLVAKRNLEIAHQRVMEQRAGHLPTVSLNGAYAVDEKNAFLGEDITSTSLSVELRLSLFEGGRVQNRVQQAHQNFIVAQEQLEQQIRKTKREARAAYLNVVSAISRVKALGQALKSTQTALKATQAGFDVGTRTSVDILDAQRELFRARRDYARTRYDLIRNHLALKQAVGSLSPEDLYQVNRWLKPGNAGK